MPKPNLSNHKYGVVADQKLVLEGTEKFCLSAERDVSSEKNIQCVVLDGMTDYVLRDLLSTRAF